MSAHTHGKTDACAHDAHGHAAFKARVAEEYAHAASWYGGFSSLQNWSGLGLLRYRLFRQARGRTLDVAAGTGSNFSFYPASVSLTAVDLSPEMLAMARRKAHRLGRPMAFHAMDAEALDFPDGTFDTVASSLSLCTFPDPVKALREMSRVARPGGRILLLEHGRSDFAWLAGRQDAASRTENPFLGCRKNRDYLRLAKEAGLRVLDGRRNLLGVFYSIVAAPGHAAI
jgi:SAM-dependent methyltransferase